MLEVVEELQGLVTDTETVTNNENVYDKINRYNVPTEWNIPKYDRDVCQELAYELGVPEAMGYVYLSRGLDTPDKIKEFQYIDESLMHSPWLLPDIEKSVNRVEQAIRKQEHIHVHGDYDADGVTSVTVMVRALKLLKANFTYHTPHRIYEGYGLKRTTVEKAANAGTKVLITVDCGIRDYDAAIRAKELLIDLIVTDHHQPAADGTIPDAYAVVNPSRLDSTYPFPGLAGVGVAFKFVMALCERFGVSNKRVIEGLMEYVAIGTVADMVPLINENRYIVKYGLEKLNLSTRHGIVELAKVCRIKNIDTTAIGFNIGPRINAAGRLSDSGIALDLMLAEDQTTAKRLAKEVELLNIRRQEMSKIVVKEALEMLPEDMSDVKVAILKSTGWHAGIVGLVATTLVQNLGRPVMVGVEANGVCKASCRSTEGFHILNGMNYAAEKFSKENSGEKLFDSYGGHAHAAGFAIPAENLIHLYRNINEKATQEGYIPMHRVNVDAKISSIAVTPELYKAIQTLAPFGQENSNPVFMSPGLEIIDIETLKDGTHLKLKLKNIHSPDNIITAMWWKHGYKASFYAPGDKIDIVYTISYEDFKGFNNITLILEDIRHSKKNN